MMYRRAKSRRGVQTLELILVAPIIVAALVATLEFGMLNITHGAITHAATVGAREAGKLSPAGNIVLSEVVDKINDVLAANDIQISDAADSGTKVTIQDGADPGTPLVYGDPNLPCSSPLTPVLDADEVSVTLCIEFDATKLNNAPVIDLFSLCGFTFNGKQFHITSLVKKEV